MHSLPSGQRDVIDSLWTSYEPFLPKAVAALAKRGASEEDLDALRLHVACAALRILGFPDLLKNWHQEQWSEITEDDLGSYTAIPGGTYGPVKTPSVGVGCRSEVSRRTLAPMTAPPSGTQFEINYKQQSARIVEVGGGIRSYKDAGRDVLQPYDRDPMCDGAHGAPLIPWPNRLADGRYGFDGTDYQVALTEPAKHNAIHGFLHWRPWQVVEHDAERIVMASGCSR